MRLWPYQMLDVLPSPHMLSQWRECCGVSGIIKNNNSHYIVDRVKNYSIEHFVVYCMLVKEEFQKREYRIGTNAIETLDNNINFSEISKHINFTRLENGLIEVELQNKNHEILFSNWHNERYLIQCLHYFQEKYDCNGISKEQWNMIYNKFKDKIQY